MPSAGALDAGLRRMPVDSPRSPLNCQVLSLHLPHPSESQPSRSKLPYTVPGYRYSTSPTSTFSGSKTLSPPYPLAVSSLPGSNHMADYSGDMTRLSKGFSRHDSDTISPLEGSNDESSSLTQDSPGSMHISMGSPNMARRAKAHVPSACVNCKKKHLACETRRPCNRCLQAGKEATCVDVQHKKRGRPRLRDEESGRGVHSGSDYSRQTLYPAQPDALPPQGFDQRAQYRPLSYREIRSHPDALYRSSLPGQSVYGQTSNGVASHLSQDYRDYHINLPETNPSALLNLDFLILQSNQAFSNALSLRSNIENTPLDLLVLPSETEKIQRLQNSLRNELQETAQLHTSRRVSIDCLASTSGFTSRSEYWTFRLPGDQSRGFPISISLARASSSYCVLLTLLASTSTAQKSLMTLPPPTAASQSTSAWTSSLPSPNSVSMISPSMDLPGTGAGRPRISSHGSRPLPYHPPHPGHIMQSTTHSDPVAYRQPPRSPPADEYGSSPEATRPRHLQLPPIRTVSIERGGDPKNKGSPQSGKRGKRRRVDVGELLR